MHVKVKDGRVKESPSELKDFYRETLENALSEREIQVLNKDGGLRINIKKIKGEHDAFYGSIIEDKHDIGIEPRSKYDKETIIHETIHALQEHDPGRPKIYRRFSFFKPIEPTDYGCMDTLTEAETIARVDEVNLENTPYYTGEDQDKKKMSDRMKLTDNTNIGQKEKSIQKVKKKFNSLDVAEHKHPGADKTAKERFSKIKNMWNR